MQDIRIRRRQPEGKNREEGNGGGLIYMLQTSEMLLTLEACWGKVGVTHFREPYAYTSWRKTSSTDADEVRNESSQESGNERGMSREIKMELARKKK